MRLVSDSEPECEAVVIVVEGSDELSPEGEKRSGKSIYKIITPSSASTRNTPSAIRAIIFPRPEGAGVSSCLPPALLSVLGGFLVPQRGDGLRGGQPLLQRLDRCGAVIGIDLQAVKEAHRHLIGQLLRTGGGNEQVVAARRARARVGRRVAGQNAEQHGGQPVYVCALVQYGVKAVLLRRGVSGAEPGLQIGADGTRLGQQKAAQTQPAVLAEDQLLGADAEMENAGVIRQKAQSGEQRHKQRARFLPAQPSTQLGQAGCSETPSSASVMI